MSALKKSSGRSKLSKERPQDDEAEFTLMPVDDEDVDGFKTMNIAQFLRKFEDVLPKQEQEKFGFLAEAHFRQVIQLLPSEGRMNNSAKVVVQAVRQSEETMSMLDFLETFFTFSSLAKEIGIPAREFAPLIVNTCKDWFAGHELVVQLDQF